jgi:hypothetical protein
MMKRAGRTSRKEELSNLVVGISCRRNLSKQQDDRTDKREIYGRKTNPITSRNSQAEVMLMNGNLRGFAANQTNGITFLVVLSAIQLEVRSSKNQMNSIQLGRFEIRW